MYVHVHVGANRAVSAAAVIFMSKSCRCLRVCFNVKLQHLYKGDLQIK